MLPERKGRKGEKNFLEAVRNFRSAFTVYELYTQYEGVSKSTARRHLSKFIDNKHACVWIEDRGLRRQWYTLTEEGRKYIEARLEQIELDEGADKIA